MRGRVLIVDDNPMNVDILRRILRKEFVLQTATNGQECLDLIPEFRPQLVLLDIMMPGLSGYEVCERIKSGAVGGLVPVILVSGKGSPEDIQKGYESQADDYLVKPFDHKQLLEKVRERFPVDAPSRDDTTAAEPVEVNA